MTGTVVERLHREATVVDLHVHTPDFIPQPFRRVYHAVSPRRPRDTGFDVLGPAGVDVAVATAVGDPIVTRWYLGRSPWQAVEAQLALIERQAARHHATVVRGHAEIERARAASSPAILLGVEGADALAQDVDRVDAWYERGVRLVVLVHLADNQLGTTCLPWQQYAGPLPVRRASAPGLSPLGRAVVRRMDDRGMVVDLAHADGRTLRDVVDVATAPVVSSHTGARAVQDFARYLDDEELRIIAATGGVIGLWPYRAARRGVRTIEDLMAHARHVASVVGPEHLCLGTDMNGVPGVMAGYGGEGDVPLLTAALLETGFSAPEVRGIVGENALRVVRMVAPS
ncbi:membrane dipeptidase [soil metagenome]